MGIQITNKNDQQKAFVPNMLSNSIVSLMVKGSMHRHLESTGEWVACGGRDQYLLQSKLLSRPGTGKLQQNLLKLEIKINDCCWVQAPDGDSLTYDLDLTIRLCKVLYLDTRRIGQICD